MATVVLDPVRRIEGHLRVDTRVEDGQVVEAWSRGEMFRGFERILTGRDPLDAPMITQRICGVCPVSHAGASCRTLESALGFTPPPNGQLLRNLVVGAKLPAESYSPFLPALGPRLRQRGGSPQLRRHRSGAEKS